MLISVNKINLSVFAYDSVFQLSLSSPVHCFPLWKFVRDKLQECRSVYGHETFQYAMDSMDSAVVTQLGTFINH